MALTSPYEEWGLNEAREALPAVPQWAEENLAFYKGDHWQAGMGWSGPMLDSTDANYARTMERIGNGFVSVNAIGEIVDRHVGGLLGRTPNFYTAVRRPLATGEDVTADEQTLIDEADALLAGWWNGQRGVMPDDDQGIRVCTPLEVAKRFCTNLLLARRASLRLFLSPGAIGADEETGQPAVPKLTAEEALANLYLQQPEPGQAGVYINQKTLRPAGVFRYEDPETGEEFVEFCYLSATGTPGQTTIGRPGETVIKVFGREGAGESAATLDLGGRLTIYEAQRPELVDDSIRRAQRALNKAKTMGSRNLDQGGFLERLFMNAQMPGTWNDDMSEFTPAAFQVGAGTANFLVGIPITDEQGRVTGYTTPTPYWKDPVPTTVFEQAAGGFYRDILGMADQTYALIAGDATSSGESRIQAKDDYRRSLLTTKGQIDAAVRWVLETVLAMAAVFAGTPGRYAGLQVVADSQIDLGVLSAGEFGRVIAAHGANLLSRETAMRRIGVESPVSEATLLDAEANSLLAPLQRRAELIKALVDAGVELQAAAIAAGMTEKEAGRLAQGDAPDGVTQ